MNRDIPTKIDVIQTKSETVCVLSISQENAANVSIMLNAFRLELIERLAFSDGAYKVVIQHHDNSNRKKKSNTCVLSILDTLVDVSYEWIDVLTQMFLNVVLNGWSDVAHIDQDFASSDRDISISINIVYP